MRRFLLQTSMHLSSPLAAQLPRNAAANDRRMAALAALSAPDHWQPANNGLDYRAAKANWRSLGIANRNFAGTSTRSQSVFQKTKGKSARAKRRVLISDEASRDETRTEQ